MKRVLLALLILVMTPLVPALVSAENSVNVYINGNEWGGADSAVLLNSSVFVPLGVIRDGLGIKTNWNSRDQSIVLQAGATVMSQTVGYLTASVDGKTTQLAVAPIVLDGKPYVPIRSIASVFRIKATWDGLNHCLYLFKNDRNVAIQSASPEENLRESGQSAAGEKASPPAVGKDSSILLGADRQNEAGLTLTDLFKPEKSALVNALDSGKDGVVVHTNGVIRPIVFTLPDPYRIVVDLPNASLDPALLADSSAPNGEIASKHPYVEKIRYALFNNDPVTVRIVIDLNRKADFKLIDDQDNNRIVISIPTKVYKVVIDPGHGGKDPGSAGYSKTDEKWFTLAMAKKVAAVLDQDAAIEPILTRSDDSTISLDERVAFANRIEADLFVSIHANIYEKSSKIRGTETYYARSDSILLAEELHKRVVGAAGFPDRGVRKQDYRVIKYTKMPAALLEIGYMSNPTDESYLLNEDFQQRMAGEIAAGIKSYLKQM